MIQETTFHKTPDISKARLLVLVLRKLMPRAALLVKVTDTFFSLPLLTHLREGAEVGSA